MFTGWISNREDAKRAFIFTEGYFLKPITRAIFGVRELQALLMIIR